MKVFWYQGGLHFEPEGSKDHADLKRMAESWGTLENMGEASSTSPMLRSGQCESGDEGLLNLFVRSHQVAPSRLTGQTRHKDAVVCIKKPR